MTTNFDRAADFYDDTRGLPEATQVALIDRLEEGLGRATKVLEIGVGTGRVAVPLSKRGYSLTGIDVSEKMLAVLQAKSSAVEAQVANATNIPFDDASFDTVLAVDFFHLVSEWRRAVEESVRVLKSGGRIVLSTFSMQNDPTSMLRTQIFELAGARPKQTGIDIKDVMTELEDRYGATTMELDPVPLIMNTSLTGELDNLRNGTWSRYWKMPDDLRHQVADRVESELRHTRIDMDESLDIEINLRIMMATLPANDAI